MELGASHMPAMCVAELQGSNLSQSWAGPLLSTPDEGPIPSCTVHQLRAYLSAALNVLGARVGFPTLSAEPWALHSCFKPAWPSTMTWYGWAPAVAEAEMPF
jgi:hypothetical protein